MNRRGKVQSENKRDWNICTLKLCQWFMQPKPYSHGTSRLTFRQLLAHTINLNRNISNQHHNVTGAVVKANSLLVSVCSFSFSYFIHRFSSTSLRVSMLGFFKTWLFLVGSVNYLLLILVSVVISVSVIVIIPVTISVLVTIPATVTVATVSAVVTVSTIVTVSLATVSATSLKAK